MRYSTAARHAHGLASRSGECTTAATPPSTHEQHRLPTPPPRCVETGLLTKAHVQYDDSRNHTRRFSRPPRPRRGPKSPTAGSLGVVDAYEGRTARAALERVKSHILPQAQEPEPEHAPTRRRRRAAHATYKRSAPSTSPPRAASTRRRHAAEEARSVDRRSR